MGKISVVFVSYMDCFKLTRVLSWHATPCTTVTKPTPSLWIQLVVTVCYLPATTTFSSLPFRARSLLGSWVLSAIESAAASDTETRRSQTARACVEENNSETSRVFRDASIARAVYGERGRGGETAAKTPSIWIFITRGQRRALHNN